MTNVPIEEFQQLCKLSDSAMLWLLKNNSVQCLYDKEQGLSIDVSSVKTQVLVKAILAHKDEYLSKQEERISTTISKMISEEMFQITTEVLANIKQ